MVGTVVRDGRNPAPYPGVRAAAVRSPAQPAPSRITEPIREHPAAPPGIPDPRAERGVPSWKRRILESLASELDRRGASRGARAGDDANAEDIDARIRGLVHELRARAQNRTGYDQPGAARTGVVVSRAV